MTQNLDPHNIDAEESVIGSLLIDPDSIVFIRDIMTGADFYIKRHSYIYDAIKHLFDRKVPTDLVTVSDELDRMGKLDAVGGQPALTQLINVTPTSIHIQHYAQIVKRDSIRRQMMLASAQISKMAFDSTDDDPDQLLQRASNVLHEVSSGNLVHRPQPLKTYTERFFDHLDHIQESDGVVGLPTGLRSMDRMLGGLQPGKLYLIAGRPGMGKSSLAMQIGSKVAKTERRPVLYFSLEMPGDELTSRIISAESNIDGEALMHGPIPADSWAGIFESMNYVSNWPIYIDDRTRTIEGIRARSILQSASGLDLIIVDYIQRIQSGAKFSNRDSEVGEIGRALKDLALDLKVPVVAISSLNRSCEARSDKRPMLGDLRESGSLEYEADTVIFTYRDEVYYPNTDHPNIAELIISKQRGGKLSTVKTYFRKHLTTFVDLELRQQIAVNGNGYHKNGHKVAV